MWSPTIWKYAAKIAGAAACSKKQLNKKERQNKGAKENGPTRLKIATYLISASGATVATFFPILL